MLLEENARLRARLGDAPKAVDPPQSTNSTPSANPRRMTPRDDVTIDRRPVVIDVVPTLLDARAPVEPSSKRPAPEPSPAPQPTEPGRWDESENGKAFRQWYDAGKYDVLL
jgi:hypothetical protein